MDDLRSWARARFRRAELSLRAVRLSRSNEDYVEYYDPTTRLVYNAGIQTQGTGRAYYLQPAAALVQDNSVSAWVGPIMGRRSRLEWAPAFGFGTHLFHDVTADFRRYDVPFRPFTIATRLLFFGRFGSDSLQYRNFLGWSNYVRGYTAGSFRNHECRAGQQPTTQTGCSDLDQMIGSKIAVANVKWRAK